MSEQEPAAPELEAAPTANGSVPSEETGHQAVTDKDVEDSGDKVVGNEKGSSEEQKDENGKAASAEILQEQRDESVKAASAEHLQEQGDESVEAASMETLQEHRDECVKAEAVSTETLKERKDERIKVADAMDASIEEPEDAKRVENESIKISEGQEVKNAESGDTKLSGNDVKMLEVEDGKVLENEASKVQESEDVTMTDAEAVKDDQVSEEGEEEKEAENEEEIEKEEKTSGETEKKSGEVNQAKGEKRKRGRGRKVSEEGDAKGKKGVSTKAEEVLNTPVASSSERPVRERRTVERLVEVIEKEPSREFLVEKGRGTPLKDIPNVSHKIARKKPGDLKLLHQTLFGRRGKAINFKSHILQFSGFVWHENEEKQRAKLKEKLDKFVKDTLVDLCDLFDIPVSKATTRKEDLVVKLLDFMAAPYATSDAILTEEQQSTKSRKRRRVAKGSVSRSASVTPGGRSRKVKNDETPKSKGSFGDETEDEDDVDEEEDTENGVPDEDDDALKHSESEAKESESENTEEDDDNEDDDGDDSERSKHDLKKSAKLGGSTGTQKSKSRTSPKKASFSAAKSPTKASSSKLSKVEDSNSSGAKVFSRKRKNESVPSKKSTPMTDTKSPKSPVKKVAKGKAKSESGKDSGPSKKELREAICEILKEVDFNTATFTDILKQLAGRYNTDLTSRKKAIKLMIQDELTKLADEAEENEDEDDDEGDAEKDENPGPKAKEVEA